MGLSVFKILLIVIVVLIVFGAGKLPKVMGDIGKGLKNFKDALNDNATSETTKVEKLDEKTAEEEKKGA